MFYRKSGFTLIELLVVIAIIALLATVVIVKVKAARSKAIDTTMEQNFRVLKTNIIQYGVGSDSYGGMCNDDSFVKQNLLKISGLYGVSNDASGDWGCIAGGGQFVIFLQVYDKNDGLKYLCVDSSDLNLSSARVLHYFPGANPESCSP